MERYLALELVSTIRHDGEGGVTDDLCDVAGAARWLDAQAELFAGNGPLVEHAGRLSVDETARGELVALRQAVRTLFARAVSPGPPSPADVGRLLPVQQALDRLNTAAAREPTVPQLRWCKDELPVAHLLPSADSDPLVRLNAALARAAIAFLAGPERELLRACTAPRCVRYYVKRHGRQEWCKPSCGNRARVARHYHRRHAES
ncbi:CGNR zinc finger domain-containing protein (plasmid) [Streptomyces sp. CA-294286]|uniref:CGNR zinc finger domain-containing protein n=1 Tax=Streptomyces sp. CA-294286 TaxID=3240070 RepID=UPI003D8E4F8B